MDKNYFPRLINLATFFSPCDTAGSPEKRGQWYEIKLGYSCRRILNGTDSVGLVQENEEFSKLNINPEVISKSGTKTNPASDARRFQDVSQGILQGVAQFYCIWEEQQERFCALLS
jgi:hypothetical protein